MSAGLKPFESVGTVGQNYHAVTDGECFLAFACVMDNRAFANKETFHEFVLVPKFVVAEVVFRGKG